MDIVGSLILFIGLAFLAHYYVKKKSIELEAKLETVDHGSTIDLQQEMQRRNRIKEKVEEFLKESKFFDPIATWRNEKIYKFIFNKGYLYEFDEIMPENNQRIGLDDNFLCFKQLNYKRVNNPEEFIQKFGNEIRVEKTIAA